MSRKATQILLVLALMALGGLLVIQIIWFGRAFDLREQQFNEKINLVLRETGHELLLAAGDSTSRVPTVQLKASNYYYLPWERDLDYGAIQSVLKSTMNRHGIEEPYQLALYNCENSELVLGLLLGNFPSSNENAACLDREQEGACFNFAVSFPSHKAHLWQSMSIWAALTLIFLLVLAYFVYSLFIMLKEKRLSDMRKDFIDNLTHELKTPIANIGMASEVLKNPENQLTKEKAQRYANIIHSENERLKGQVDQVLQIAFLEKEGLDLHLEALNINKLIEEIIYRLQPKIGKRKGQINFIQQAENPQVKVDRFHLTNLLHSLIDNAEKYSPDQPEIAISTNNSREGLWVTVADRGIGIAKEAQQYVFDRFYRVPTGDIHNVKGSGLGLSYAKLVVEAHGGAIKLESQPNQGSRFSFLLRHG